MRNVLYLIRYSRPIIIISFKQRSSDTKEAPALQKTEATFVFTTIIPSTELTTLWKHLRILSKEDDQTWKIGTIFWTIDSKVEVCLFTVSQIAQTRLGRSNNVQRFDCLLPSIKISTLAKKRIFSIWIRCNLQNLDGHLWTTLP